MKLISMLSHPGLPAASSGPRVVGGERTYTRAEALAAVAHMADSLREQGLRPGHRVLALVDHDERGLFFLAAASAIGLRLLMPYNLQAAALPEWLNLVASARPDFVVDAKRDGACGQALRQAGARVAGFEFLDESLAALPDRRPVTIDAPDPVENFLVLFTSGTTGRPKAISLSESLVCRRIASVTRWLDFRADARIFMSGLLNNTTGVIFSFGALLHDATLVFPTSRNVEDWPAQVARSRATHLMLRPVALKRFVAALEVAPVDLGALRTIAYGAAAMPRALLERARALMPCNWVQGYGLSETFGPFCWLDEAGHRDGLHRRHVYCVGRPDETLEVAIDPAGAIDGVGEVLLRGSAVMEGYCDVHTGVVSPPGEWLRTGDLGQITPQGELVLKGRIDNTVMSENGHRIYPEEVEAALSGIPGVADAVLLGIAGQGHAALVTRPVACISGELAASEPGHIRDVVASALSKSLSREKWPGWIFASVAPFPKSGNDKVMKAEVARLVDAGGLIDV